MTMLVLAFACSHSPDPSDGTITNPWIPGEETTAVVASVARDYSVGVLATVDLDDWTVRDNLATVSGDSLVRFDDGSVIVLNGFGVDTVRLYDPGLWSAPRLEIGTSEGEPTNPHDAAICDGRLFVLLYEEAAVAIMDPATGASIGTVPLGEYADADGIPEAWNLVEVDDTLYVALNRLDRNDDWSDAGGMIVEIACDSGEVVRTWSTAANVMLHRWVGDDRILVTSRAFGDLPGGISILDPSTGEMTQIVDQATLGGTSDEIVGFGSHAIVASLDTQDKGYAQTAIQCVDLHDGTVTELDTTDHFVTSVEGNQYGEAWVGIHWGWDASDFQPGIRVFDVDSCSERTHEPIEIGLAPYSIAFY